MPCRAGTHTVVPKNKNQSTVKYNAKQKCFYKGKQRCRGLTKILKHVHTWRPPRIKGVKYTNTCKTKMRGWTAGKALDTAVTAIINAKTPTGPKWAQQLAKKVVLKLRDMGFISMKSQIPVALKYCSVATAVDIVAKKRTQTVLFELKYCSQPLAVMKKTYTKRARGASSLCEIHSTQLKATKQMYLHTYQIAKSAVSTYIILACQDSKIWIMQKFL